MLTIFDYWAQKKTDEPTIKNNHLGAFCFIIELSFDFCIEKIVDPYICIRHGHDTAIVLDYDG